MSDMQNILAALIAAIKEKRITVDVAEAAVRMLDGVPDYSHMDAVKALLRTPSNDEEQPEEQPEDYLAVKTYTSDKFSVGDEITDGSDKYVILKKGDSVFWVTGSGSKLYVQDCAANIAYMRTGRNFPAIAAIMEELKKG